MPSDYEQITRENIKYYGEGFADFAPRLLHDLYASPAHFIFELLQNAEDALARRGESWQGERIVSFDLNEELLRVSHRGEVFDADDVRGICAIGKTTKELTDIGRFGIGFKSVYKFTCKPEIHSGDENFAIDKYVRPQAAAPVDKHPGETVILMPLKSDMFARDTIINGMETLGAGALLFLRHIDEVRWTVDEKDAGHYLRQSENMDSFVRRITVMGEQRCKPEEAEEWLVFSRPVGKDNIGVVGSVEIAFCVADKKIRRVRHSPVVAYFPTVRETNLGFLIQGPYRTNSGRNDIPSDDDWNSHLIGETASLLPESLLWLRDKGYLDAGALQCLPLDESKFIKDASFKPLFDAAKRTLASESLLPRHGAGYTPANAARFAGSEKLRELFAPPQLAALCGKRGELAWISGDITSDLAPDLYKYVRHELKVDEIDGEGMARRLGAGFLKQQTDRWVQNLYQFFGSFGERSRLRQQLSNKPIVRLEDGRHVSARGGEKVFLPGKMKTDFPTVRAAVCRTKESRAFLEELGLVEPNPVDDIIDNILPKYRGESVAVGDDEYNADIARIIKAAKTDKISLREKLTNALKKTAFVKGVNAGGGEQKWLMPGDAYLPTKRLRRLFAGVDGVWFVDNSFRRLRGSAINALLGQCGAAQCIRPVGRQVFSHSEEAVKMRKESGYPDTSNRKDNITDWDIAGLDLLLKKMPTVHGKKRRAKMLWEELACLSDKCPQCFRYEYTWTHYGDRRASGNAAFVRLLQGGAWVPGGRRGLLRPGKVVFDSLGWDENPFLRQIIFNSPAIDALAEEAGVQRDAIAFLKEHNITADDLRELLEKQNKARAPKTSPAKTGSPATKPAAQKVSPKDSSGGKQTFTSFIRTEKTQAANESGKNESGGKTCKQILGEKAVAIVCGRESQWKVASANNKGYDLYQTGDGGGKVCWCEVKAVSGGWDNQPVMLTHSQFEFAREKRDAFWLYVVEYADTDDARIIRIQNPAGRNSKFLFDSGWRFAGEK